MLQACGIFKTHIQVYFVLLHFTLLYFTDTMFFVVVVYKSKVCDNSASSRPIGTIFPTAFAHSMSLYHILIIQMIFQVFFYNYHACYCDL